MPDSSDSDDAPEISDPLEILYEDEHYIAINKPPGLLVHRTGIDSRETRFALQQLRDQIERHVFPVHRLDKPTSGLLLFALDEVAQTTMARLFEERSVAKSYHAIVRGYAPESGEIDHPLRKLLDRGPQSKSADSQEARTRFRRLSRVEMPFPSGAYPTTRYSLVELKPLTGRRHQLRRHMDHIHCPIIGDTRHGDSRQNKAFREHFGYGRLFLHASSLSFKHPFSGEEALIEAPLWPDFSRALQETGLGAP